MPVPVLTTFVTPLLSWIVPENVPLVLPLPTVKLGVPPPATLSMVPPPLSPPTEALKPLISRTAPPATVRLPVLAPNVAVPLANCSVPLWRRVPPL